jgi:hypothetical protein
MDDKPQNSDGGLGGGSALEEGLADPLRRRGTLQMMRRGLEQGWMAPVQIKALMEKVPGWLETTGERAMQEGDGRTLVGCAKVAASLLKINLDISRALDEAERNEQTDTTRQTLLEAPDIVAAMRRVTAPNQEPDLGPEADQDA